MTQKLKYSKHSSIESIYYFYAKLSKEIRSENYTKSEQVNLFLNWLILLLLA